MNTKRKCSNCAFCQRFKYSQKDDYEMMRCWQESGVCDHAFCQTMKEAENYVCDEHRFKEEREKELFEEAKERYEYYKKCINDLEEKYPVLKEDIKPKYKFTPGSKLDLEKQFGEEY